MRFSTNRVATTKSMLRRRLQVARNPSLTGIGVEVGVTDGPIGVRVARCVGVARPPRVAVALDADVRVGVGDPSSRVGVEVGCPGRVRVGRVVAVRVGVRVGGMRLVGVAGRRVRVAVATGRGVRVGRGGIGVRLGRTVAVGGTRVGVRVAGTRVGVRVAGTRVAVWVAIGRVAVAVGGPMSTRRLQLIIPDDSR
jgi:hypothetical protein